MKVPASPFVKLSMKYLVFDLVVLMSFVAAARKLVRYENELLHQHLILKMNIILVLPSGSTAKIMLIGELRRELCVAGSNEGNTKDRLNMGFF